MSDERPKPRFGELAPEGWSWTPPPTEGEQEVLTEQPVANDAVPAGRRRRRGDFWLTITLLAVGVFFSASSVPGYFRLGEVFSQYFAQQGLGEFTAYQAADRAGEIAAITQIVLLFATIAISILLLRAGRISFYVPLIGAVLAFITSVVCLSVALLADPAIQQLGTVTTP